MPADITTYQIAMLHTRNALGAAPFAIKHLVYGPGYSFAVVVCSSRRFGLFKLSTTNEHINRKIVCNRDLGFTRTREQGAAMLREHGLSWYFEPPEPWFEAR